MYSLPWDSAVDNSQVLDDILLKELFMYFMHMSVHVYLHARRGQDGCKPP